MLPLRFAMLRLLRRCQPRHVSAARYALLAAPCRLYADTRRSRFFVTDRQEKNRMGLTEAVE